SATARGSSRSPKPPPATPWRCRSSRRWTRRRWTASARSSPRPSAGPDPGIIARPMSRFRKPPDPRFWRLNRSLPFDWQLAIYDLDQSLAHARGLRAIGVLSDAELGQIEAGLERVRVRMGSHGFEFEEADEDIHMAIERLLGEEIGPLAGKLHTGRSRND